MSKSPLVYFRFHGNVPSKANFRRGGQHWRRQWARIRAFEHDVGLLALASGARVVEGEVEVSMVLVNQSRIDTDAAIKATLDALENVCYRNDKQVSSVAIGRERREGEEPSLEIQVREARAKAKEER